ncbi:alpha/beta-hydrolase [Athelia psychrophila]|uniref:Alpha/beta-hydrolase n=1 Tax=Athelia psychrophila TaxID=1759441 RepID=A0A166CK88_9AGAM|nr:alpha/beta-hydrolase [Fibularhizoctonia sp. CBS 109695]
MDFPPDPVPYDPVTLVYSKVDGLELKVDIYVPPNATGSMPAIICWHGGGMVIGDRKPRDVQITTWMIEMAMVKGIIYISPDYRLLYPSNSRHQLDDVRSLSRFLSAEVNSHLPNGAKVDTARIAVSGSSAGVYLARMAAIHVQPRPVAFFSLYGMGGDWMLDWYLAVKSEPVAFVGVMLPKEAVAGFFDPAHALQPVAENPFVVADGGVWADSLKRMVLFPWWLQTGEIVDYVSGQTGLSEVLRALPYAEREAAIPPSVAELFPQRHISAQFPPSIFIHGDADGMVPVSESTYTHEQLQKAGVESELHLVPGGEHGLNVKGVYIPGAEDVFAKAFAFFVKHLL